MAKNITFNDIRTQIHPRLYSPEFCENLNKLSRIRVAGELYLTFYIMFDETDEEKKCLAITEEMAEVLGTDAEELARTAMANEAEEYSVLPIMQALLNIIEPDNEYDRDDETLYVISNRSNLFGAAGILSPAIQKKLTEMFPEGCYLLPSSVHEFLATPVGPADPEDLAKMVFAINRDEDCVNENDRLSDHVFMFANGKITVAA